MTRESVCILTLIASFIVMLYGYVANIVKLVTSSVPFAEWTVLEVFRTIGIIIPFVGSVLGYV